ncbi:MAG: ADP-forming succinate--CoA ligase subunit beta [Gammaproteobacteria bacterium]
MNLHEYQAKQLFAQYGLPVSKGLVVTSGNDAKKAIQMLGGSRWVVKAQVHAGGRGKAGGVKLFDDAEKAEQFVHDIMGTNLVTYQTDKHGQPVNQVLIETPCDIAKELYLSALVDRSLGCVVFMASTEGGVDIEAVAHDTPEKIHRVAVDPYIGALPYQGRDLAFKLGLTEAQTKQFVQLYMGLGKMMIERDLSVLEINPLVIKTDGNLLCLDAKVTMDDNAGFRQPELVAMRDPTQEDARVNKAHEWDLNYIPLEGNIGCMVNGAGLAMATMDIIKLHGGEPANFLDVGGGATQERVREAFKIILSDDSVKGILVNIFGGIVRCDLIADGIIAAVKEVGVTVPVVVRLEGNRADEGAKILAESGLNVVPAHGLSDAAQKIVDAVRAVA